MSEPLFWPQQAASSLAVRNSFGTWAHFAQQICSLTLCVARTLDQQVGTPRRRESEQETSAISDTLVTASCRATCSPNNFSPL